MKHQALLDLYPDYRLSSMGPTTGTGLSRLTEAALRHARVQRFVARAAQRGTGLGPMVKCAVGQVQRAQGGLMSDASSRAKAHPDEKDRVVWDTDQTRGQRVNGSNGLTAL